MNAEALVLKLKRPGVFFLKKSFKVGEIRQLAFLVEEVVLVYIDRKFRCKKPKLLKKRKEAKSASQYIFFLSHFQT